MEMPNISKKELARFIKNTLLVIAGTAVLAFGTGLFLIPFNLVSGGVSGIGIILEQLLFEAPVFAGITAEVYASVLVWVLFFVGLLFLGKFFALQTLVSTIVYPFFLNLGTWLADSDFLGGFFNLCSDMYIESFGGTGILLAAVFGGVCVGAGSALTFLGGGSTGGSDIIPLVICKFFPKLKTSLMIFITDASVVVLGMFAVGNLIITLLGVAAAFICAIVVDKLFLGESSAFIAHIVSERYDEINAAVIEKMHRTTTITTAIGGYTGAEKKLIMVTFSVRQYHIFAALVSSIDKNAFIAIHRAHEISGDGWTYNYENYITEE